MRATLFVSASPILRRRRSALAFTLVELLVVLGIIGLLMAILLPSLAGARRQSRTLVCASNLRQLSLAMINYATDHKGQFPPNIRFPSPGWLWYYPAMAGGYASKDGPALNSVFVCPDDLDGAKRSYSMNAWMSSGVDAAIKSHVGQLWGPTPPDSTRVILLTESWSCEGSETDDGGREAKAVIGYLGDTAGKRFGGDGGIAPPVFSGPFGNVNSQLSFARHRGPGSRGSGTQPIGAVNIAYVDGHVDLRTDRDLVDPETGKSTLNSLWSPLDYENP